MKDGSDPPQRSGGRSNGAGVGGGGPSRAHGEAPVSEYNGGDSMSTRSLRSWGPAHQILSSIADVLQGAAAGRDSLLGSAMAAGHFGARPNTLASVSSDTSSPSLDFPNASHHTPAHSLVNHPATSSAGRSQGGGSRVQADPLASARPLQAIAFEEFLREKHRAGVNPKPCNRNPEP
jgi:hypothetical protein